LAAHSKGDLVAGRNDSGGGRKGGPWGSGPSRGPQNTPDLEEILKRGQDKLKQVMPGGSGISGPVALLVTAVLIAVVAFFAFTFRVNPDELGVVMRFGKVNRQEPPGLHFRMPYPIDEVRLPKVTQQNIIEIGMRSSGGTRNVAGSVTSVREESLMLTGDENIVEIYFVVFWRIQDPLKYLFNIQNPECTVKSVAESTMREVVGQSNIAPILTGARQKTELAVQTLMQGVLDKYGSGIRVDQVQLQKIDPPTQVIDAFRDVQAAAADKQKLQNEALGYAGRIVPEARGEAERILQGAKGYQLQTVAEATGQTARFLKVLEEYKKAPDVTRTRMYLETMERVLGSADKIIIDSKSSQGVVPFLPLDQIQKRKDGSK
jgi:modulator of FtsH protease HflK